MGVKGKEMKRWQLVATSNSNSINISLKSTRGQTPFSCILDPVESTSMMATRASMLFLFAAVVAMATVARTRAQTGDVIFVPDSYTCEVSPGKPGHCVLVSSCQSVLKVIREGGPSPPTCGFQGREPKVCCPPVSTTGTTVTEGPDSALKDISEPDGYSALDCGRGNIKVVRFSVDAPFIGSALARRKRGFDVVGGVESSRNAWPWMALIGENDSQGINWFCAGVLINEHWVLSALHCFLKKEANVVRLGEHDYSNDRDEAKHEDFDVAEVVIYPGYIHPQAYHDLALLRLASRVTLKRFISPVCLPWGRESSVDLTGKDVTLTGWGDTLYGGRPSTVLQEVNITVFPSSRCEESYSNLRGYSTTWPKGIGEETVCAGDPNGGRDACQGDSGGPIVSVKSNGRYVLAGIVSRGYGCGHKDYPGLYANTRNAPYLEWIKRVAF